MGERVPVGNQGNVRTLPEVAPSEVVEKTDLDGTALAVLLSIDANLTAIRTLLELALQSHE